MVCSLWLSFSYTPALSWPSSYTPSSFNEEGKEWLPLIESARTLLSLFSLQKHAHVTLTFFFFFTVLAGEMCKLDPAFDTRLFMNPQLSFFILLSLSEDWQKQKLLFAAHENMKTEVIDSWYVVFELSPPGYNLHIHNTHTQRWGSNLWALSRVTAITASDMIGQPCHLPQSYTAYVHEKPNLTKLFMNTESVCNNQSYRTSKSLLGMWNGKWKTSSIIFPCHEISTPLTR